MDLFAEIFLLALLQQAERLVFLVKLVLIQNVVERVEGLCDLYVVLAEKALDSVNIFAQLGDLRIVEIGLVLKGFE